MEHITIDFGITLHFSINLAREYLSFYNSLIVKSIVFVSISNIYTRSIIYFIVFTFY